jgi:N-alpha-acetyltransferase 15/16, NatA auxiliary subunit
MNDKTKFEALPPKVQEVLTAEFKGLEASTDLKKYNDEFEAQHKTSALHAISVVKTRKLLGDDQSKSEESLLKILQMKQAQFEDAQEVIAVLRSWRSKKIGEAKTAAKERWPEVTAFA